MIDAGGSVQIGKVHCCGFESPTLNQGAIFFHPSTVASDRIINEQTTSIIRKFLGHRKSKLNDLLDSPQKAI